MGLKRETPPPKKNKQTKEKGNIYREDKASIREEFTVTMKLNIQKRNAVWVSLGC